MLRIFTKCAAVVVIVLIPILQCTDFKYENPVDVRSKDPKIKEFLNERPHLMEDNDGDGEADFFNPDTQAAYIPKDTIPPKIKILGGDTVKIPKGDPNDMVAYYLRQVTATDEEGGKVIALEHRSNVNIFEVNTVPYTIEYYFSDTSGNTATATRYVFVYEPSKEDQTPPVITLLMDTVYVQLGQPYIDEGATAFDDFDGNITNKIKTSGTVDVTKPGTYPITYSVSDLAGHVATKTRYVVVFEDTGGPDRIRPVITLKGSDTIKVGAGVKIQDFMKTYKEPGYTATDNIDGDITSKVKVGDIQNIQGTKVWYLTYDVKDAAGNAAATVRRYFLTDYIVSVDAPFIELNYKDSVIQLVLQSNGKAVWKEPGYTAYDITDGDLTKKVIVDSSELVANLGKMGVYNVIYKVTNSAGLTTTVIRRVEIVDNPFDIIAPVITLKGRNPDTTLAGGAAYKDPGATAIDNRDGDVTSRITVSGTVNVKSIGKYSLTYSCKDNAGNTSYVTRTVYVVRDTTTTDLLVRYTVPTENPLPEMNNLTFTKVDVDGDGPEAVKTAVKSFTINWSLQEKLLRNFAFQYNAEPYYKDINSSVTHTFGETNPHMNLKNSGVTGLDGSYYVIYNATKGEFIWVDQKGRFAIIWTK